MAWNAGDSTALAAFGQLGVLAAAAWFALRQVEEARTRRQQATRPYVLLRFEHSVASRQFINLVIENRGATPARDVRIEVDPPFRSTISDVDFQKWAALRDGISMLAPGERMYSLFDSLISRYAPDCTLARRYAVRVTYTSLDRRDRYSDEFTLDVGVARDSGYVTEKTIHDAAEALEKLRDTVASWTTHLNGVRTYTVDAEAYEQKQIQAMRERFAQPSDSTEPASGNADS